jgi:hypothetical protein
VWCGFVGTQIRELIEFFVESNQDPSMAGQFDDDDDMYEVRPNVSTVSD